MGRLGACIALLGLAAVAAWIYLSLDRPVRDVEVIGALLPAEALDVERRLTELKPRRLLSTDLKALREHLLGLSWPQLVQVRRVWPDTIQIRITRSLVVAKWGDEGYLTAGGELVSSLDRTADVPLLDCAVASPQKALETYRYLQDIASEDGLEIRSLAQNAFGEWRLTLSNGVRAPPWQRHAAQPDATLPARPSPSGLRERDGRSLPRPALRQRRRSALRPAADANGAMPRTNERAVAGRSC